MSGLTLYQHATNLMMSIIERLLRLADTTHDFTTPPDGVWDDDEASVLLLGGLGYPPHAVPSRDRRKNAWLARSAIPFSVEGAATNLLYVRVQPFVDEMISRAYRETQDFSVVDAAWIYENASLLPVLMHAAGTFSKQELSKLIGPVSDKSVSRPASVRLAALLVSVGPEAIARPEQVRERIRSTTEGIVRDLVGRLLLEEFVATALRKANVPFRREKEYHSLAGVVYNLRADFVVPDEATPSAFIEVRKSSERHASLYAKDKMFSAINWKGMHRGCLGIIVVDGPWSTPTLEVMGRVFDYVVPLAKAGEVAEKIREYLDGDRSVLRWLIRFQIERNPEAWD